MNWLKKYENFTPNVKIQKDKFLFDHGYQIDYEFYSGKDYIGKCEVNTTFKDDSFDDKSDFNWDYSRLFNYNNPVKKSYYKKYPYFIEISGFEIEDEYKGQGLGYKSFQIVLSDIEKDFLKIKEFIWRCFLKINQRLKYTLNLDLKL